jgi:hypothetical protein
MLILNKIRIKRKPDHFCKFYECFGMEREREKEKKRERDREREKKIFFSL